MSSKWSGYFKIVTPRPSATKMTDSQEMTDAGAYNNYTWYQRLVQGSASRMTRYREYDLMDNDVEVARALDTIAEEMTGNNPKTKEPLLLDILSEDEDNVSSTAVLTIKAALRRWSQLHDFPNKLFSISRMSIKYGDLFFMKGEKIDAKWQFIHPKNVIAAVVDEKDATNVLAWQIKSETTKPRTGGYGMPIGGKQDTQLESEIVPVERIVRYSLNDDMADTQPFGESILRPVYRSHKQKELLEDAIIIYRVQRAPERRVFYIDVGKMPHHRVKQVLESFKNEIKQKKVPTRNGGQSEVDSVYNPHSMCLALDTKIPLLDGRVLPLSEMIAEHDAGKQNWVYSINPKTGDVVPGIVSWAGVTRKNTETIKLILDNGDEIVCTPDHKFPVQGRGDERVMAKDLTPNDSLYPFNIRKNKINPNSKTTTEYEEIYNPRAKNWKYTHRIVANYMKLHGAHNESVFDEQYADCEKRTIHHNNYNSTDNSPSNLVFMHHKDHVKLHGELTNNQEVIFSVNLFAAFEILVLPDIKTLSFKAMMNRINNDKDFMQLYQDENPPLLGKKNKIKLNKIRQKLFLKFLKTFGYKNWKIYQQSKIQERIDITNITDLVEYNSNDIKLLQYLLEKIKNVSIHNFTLITYFKENIKEWSIFCELYKNSFGNNSTTKLKTRGLSVPEHKVFERVAKYFNYDNFKHMVNESANFNHRVVRIEQGEVQDTGTLTIDKEEKYHNYHTFATCSSFIFNSEDFFFAQRADGKGSRVETLPGGQGLGELADLEYFQQKVWRALKVPVSYMQESSDGGAVWNDGQIGTAYIQELRFSLYIERLQGYIERTLDTEFKLFLRKCNILVDSTSFRITLPSPSNFGKYKQLQLDSQLLSSFNTPDGLPYLSKRFALKRYLQMSDEEIISNERLKREELGLDPDSTDDADLKIIYGDASGDTLAGGGEGLGAFGGEELGMGDEKPAGEPDAGGPQDGNNNPVK